MYDNLNKLLLLSMLDIDRYMKNKDMPDAYFSTKYNDQVYQAMLPDIASYTQYITNRQQFIVDQKQHCDDSFILQQDEIL
jgi:hypothetical protein